MRLRLASRTCSACLRLRTGIPVAIFRSRSPVIVPRKTTVCCHCEALPCLLHMAGPSKLFLELAPGTHLNRMGLLGPTG